jgi:hypothetical protein
MTAAHPAAPLRPARFGLAAKLFAILILLGAVAVLITGVLGYVRARDALERTIFAQLTAARETKARQVETYFRSIRGEMRLLAASKMVVDAMRGFRDAVDELDRRDVPADMRRRVDGWYDDQYMPMVRRLLGPDTPVKDFLPVGSAPYFLQDLYIVDNPHPQDRRSLLDDPGDGSAYSKLHALYHPLMRTAAATLNLSDFLMVDPKTGRILYTVDKDADFGTSLQAGPYRHSNLAAAAARCAAAPDPSATCLEDFADYLPADGAPNSFMAAPVIDHGVVIGVLVARLSIDEIDNIVTGGRRWRQEGFGATGEAYLVGPDFTVRSGPRTFYEDPALYLAEAKANGTPENDIEDIRRYGTPVLQQRIDTVASRAALGGVEGTGEVLDFRHVPNLSSWGPVRVSGVKWGLITEIDSSEAFAPVYQLARDLMIVGAIALLVVIVTGAWLSRSLLGPLRELTAGVRRFAAGDRRHQREERPDREQEPRERGASAERPAGADRQPAARRRAGHRRWLRRGHGGLRRPGGLHRHVVRHAAGRRRLPAERAVHPLRRRRARARHREDQDGGRCLHGGVRPAGAGARPCRAHGAHGDPHGPHHARARDGAPCRDEAQGRHQQRAGGGGGDRQEQVHLRSMGRHGEPGEPHGIGRHARHHPGDALGL